MKSVTIILIAASVPFAVLQGSFPFDTTLFVYKSEDASVAFNLARYSTDIYLRDTCTTSCPGSCRRDFDLYKLPHGVQSLYRITTCCPSAPPPECIPDTVCHYDDRQYLIPVSGDTIYLKVTNIRGGMKDTIDVRLDTAKYDVDAEIAFPEPVKLLFNAHPNPFNSLVGFVLPPLSGTARLDIFNMTGIKVWSSKVFSTPQVSWSSKGYSAGIYIARLSLGGLKSYTTRIILQK